MGGKGTKISKKVTKSRCSKKMRKHQHFMATKFTHAPNDITESSDPQRDHYSNHVLQIMQRARPSTGGEQMRSFLDITDLWKKKGSETTTASFSF